MLSKICNCKSLSYLLTRLSRFTGSTLGSRQTLLQKQNQNYEHIRITVPKKSVCSVKGNRHSPGIQVDQKVPAHLSHQQVPTDKNKKLLKFNEIRRFSHTFFPKKGCYVGYGKKYSQQGQGHQEHQHHHLYRQHPRYIHI